MEGVKSIIENPKDEVGDLAETKAQTASSRVLARNTVFNLIGQVFVAAIAFISVPIIVRILGTASYGILSLAIVAFGTFAILDLGLGRSTTKFVAQYLSSGDLRRLSSTVWTSFSIQVLVGLLGGTILAILADYLTKQVINVPPELVIDARRSFYLLALSVPIVLGGSSLRGALEGAQRFDLVNLVKVSLNASTYLIPLIAGLAGLAVSTIVGLLVASRLLGMAAYLALCLDTMPMLRCFRLWDKATLPEIFSYAKWVALSNLIVPFLSQIDRYLIAAILTVEAVTFYAVPYEVLNALWIIPGSIAAALFPAFSGLRSQTDKRLSELYMRPLKYILLLLGPIVITLTTFSSEFLRLWQGPVFAERSTSVLQILAVAVLINSVEWVPANLVMGLGRPDITAICHVIQLPLYLGAAYVLITQWGIAGAAMAFALRVIFEAIFVFIASWRLAPQTRQKLLDRRAIGAVVSLALLASALAVGARNLSSTALQIGAVILSLAGYGGIAWMWLLDATDRQMLWDLLPSAQRKTA